MQKLPLAVEKGRLLGLFISAVTEEQAGDSFLCRFITKKVISRTSASVPVLRLLT